MSVRLTHRRAHTSTKQVISLHYRELTYSIFPMEIKRLGTLGVLNRISSAFDSVQESFSVLIDNWTTVTELRSIHKRLREFENNLAM